MSFDNYYPNRKDHRKPYYNCGRFDTSCRPGGSCEYCQDNRTYSVRKALASTASDLRAYYAGRL